MKKRVSRTQSPYIVVRRSRIHGRGVFAKKFISEGTRVIEYVGDKITKTESDERAQKVLDRHERDSEKGAVYIFTLNNRHDIDGDVYWNTAKYINHSCDPNCETDIIRGRIWIIALRDIEAGEEITYNYGYDYESYEDHPCYCGTSRCMGYILGEDFWPSLKRKRTMERNRRRRKRAAGGR